MKKYANYIILLTSERNLFTYFCLQADGAPFVVRSPGLSHTFVSSKQFIKEIDMAPDSVLSLQAAAKQVSSRNRA